MSELQDNYDSLKRLHDSANSAIASLEGKNKELQVEINILYQKLDNAQKAVDINKEIMRNALTDQNAIKDAYSQEIQILREKIKRLSNVN